MGRIAVLLLAALLAGCAAAPDETWLRITEVRTGGGSSSVAVIDVDASDGTSDTVDLVVQNTTTVVGSSSSSGVGITVTTVRIEYRAAGRDLPPFEFPLSFFIPSPGSGLSASETLQDVPIAPVTLKEWITNPVNFPSNLLSDLLLVEARIKLRARTDEGRELETEATVSLAFR